MKVYDVASLERLHRHLNDDREFHRLKWNSMLTEMLQHFSFDEQTWKLIDGNDLIPLVMHIRDSFSQAGFNISLIDAKYMGEFLLAPHRLKTKKMTKTGEGCG